MPVQAEIIDPATGQKASVTPRGQLIVGSISFSESFIANVDTANTAFNLVLPKGNKKFIITGIILVGDKSINTNIDAVVIIYESSTLAGIVEDNALLDVNVSRSTSLPVIGLNLITENAAKFINVKSSDVNIKVTLLGFYITE